MTIQWSVVAVFFGCSATFLEAQSLTNGPSIGWHLIGDSGPPQAFVLSPANPGITSLMSFLAPTDGQIYENDCFASTTCGIPMIAVDSIFQKVNISFYGPPNWICPELVIPVSGVEGQFGPLRAGAWTFNILSNSYAFEVSYAPLSLSVKLLPASPSIEISWPVSGETFLLESSASLGPGSWSGVTNAPVTESNRVTVRVESAPGMRFFRLQRVPLG